MIIFKCLFFKKHYLIIKLSYRMTDISCKKKRNRDILSENFKDHLNKQFVVINSNSLEGSRAKQLYTN